MSFRPAILAFLAALLLASGPGCQRPPAPAAAPPTVLSPDTVASVHWLGKRRLGYEATAFYFMRLWNLPPSARLEKQTLVKLATTPGRWLPGGTNLTEDAVAPLWRLLNDLVAEESYLEVREIRAGPNARPAFVLAIRLADPASAARWFTNLPAVLEPLTGARTRTLTDPEPDGWSLRTADSLIRLARAGDWTLVGGAPDPAPLLDEIAGRIRRDGVPFVSAGTNLWLEASLDPPRLAALFPAVSSRLSAFKQLDFSLTGDGANVITRGRLTLARPFAAPLEPWNLPVALMHEPLAGFTAVRGLQPLLAGWPLWRDLAAGAAPGQLFVWSLSGGSPYQVYCAAPLPDAATRVAAWSDRLLQSGNPWLAAHGYIGFDPAADGDGVTWGNLPDIKPFIRSAGDGWLFAGLLPDTNSAAAAPPPAGLIADVLRRPNLVYYDWEVTGPRLQPVLQLAQTTRLLLRQPQLALDSASLDCLAALVPRLGTSATIITRTAPDQLTFVRRSNLGLTSPELNLLAGWLESAGFQ
jgi:hypothetical protein